MKSNLVLACLLFSLEYSTAESSTFCPELGQNLGNFSSSDFTHIHCNPECFEQVQPTLTLYTSSSQSNCQLSIGCQLQQGDLKSLSTSIRSDLHDIHKVVFLVHGFQIAKTDLKEWKAMKNDIIKEKNTAVILVDWFHGANVDLSFLENSSNDVLSDLFNLMPYHQAAANTRYIGAMIANVIKNIRSVSKAQSLFHCVGHSLGAHACGFAGKALKKNSLSGLKRITGLDPAGPLFLESPLMTGINNGYATHLNPRDADLVDVIHTDSTWLGSFAKSGHFDFYVGEETEQEKKFGYDQPGTKECLIGSHSIAKDIFAATIKSECEIEEKCEMIGRNQTQGCQVFSGVKMGYAMQTNNGFIGGSFPITSDEDGLKCANGKEIAVEPTLDIEELRVGFNLKDACSILSSLITVGQSMARTFEDILRHEEIKHEAFRKELEENIDDWKKSIISFGIDFSGVQKASIEFQEIKLLYEKQKVNLQVLAQRTKRTTTSIIETLETILNPNIAIDGSSIKWVLMNMKSLIKRSKEKIPEIEKNLDEIATKYYSVKQQVDLGFKRMQSKIETRKKDVNAYKEKKRTTQDGTGTLVDWAQGIGGTVVWTLGMSGVFGDGGLVANALTYISGGFVIQEGLERIFEELTIEEITLALFKETKNIAIMTEALHNLLGQVYSQVLNEKADLKKRQSNLSVWYEAVKDISDTYEEDDYKFLETAMRKEQTFHVKNAKEIFTTLKKRASEYLELST